MCNREIAFYRKHPASQALEWVDISRETDTEARFGIRHAAAMQRFHVRDRDGEWKTGGFGFGEVWYGLTGWGLLSVGVGGAGVERCERLRGGQRGRGAAGTARRRAGRRS